MNWNKGGLSSFFEDESDSRFQIQELGAPGTIIYT